MVDFDEFISIREGFLIKLNDAVDRIIEEKKLMKLDYDYIEKALKPLVKNRNVDTGSIDIVVPIKKEEMIKIMLDFFMAVDPMFYNKAIRVILGQDKDIRMNIYDVHSVKNFNEEGEEDFIEYTPYGVLQNRKGRALVNIPTHSELSRKESKAINKDNLTLDDLYTIVHEISHSFDLNLDLGKPTKKEIAGEDETYEDNITRELTAEATAIAFEAMLSEYLLKNTSYSKSAVKQKSNRRINSCLQKVRIVYAKLVLAKEKEEKGEITLDFIENKMREYNMSIQGARRLAVNIVNSPRDMLMQNRYAIGGLIAPTIIKTYKTRGVEALKEYLEQAKQCNLETTLNQIGVQLNDEGINELIANFQEYRQLYDLDMGER